MNAAGTARQGRQSAPITGQAGAMSTGAAVYVRTDDGGADAITTVKVWAQRRAGHAAEVSANSEERWEWQVLGVHQPAADQTVAVEVEQIGDKAAPVVVEGSEVGHHYRPLIRTVAGTVPEARLLVG